MPDHLLTRLFLDAQEEFLAAIDHVPNPSRGGPIGSLNAAGWIVAHAGTTHDGWITDFCAGQARDPWLDNWFEAARSGPPGQPVPAFGEVREAVERLAERSARWIETVSWDDLRGPATLPAGAPAEWHGVSRAYLVARAIAHLYVHAGELSVIASLMAAGDLGLPGALPRSTPPTAPDDPTVPAVAALVRDGFVEVRRAAEVTPQPAVVGAMDRLHPVSHTLVHLLGREERYWIRELLGEEGSTALAALQALDPDGEGRAVPWEDALGAFDEVESRLARWLATVDGPAGAQPWRHGSSVGAQLARSATHFFAHAGEMMAHASLFGVADISMPGQLAHVRAAVPTVGA